MILQSIRRSRYEPIEHFRAFDDPIVFGVGPADLSPATLRVIKKNKGTMPAIDLADAMGWTLKRLQRVAKANGFDLRYERPSAKEPEPTGA